MTGISAALKIYEGWWWSPYKPHLIRKSFLYKNYMASCGLEETL